MNHRRLSLWRLQGRHGRVLASLFVVVVLAVIALSLARYLAEQDAGWRHVLTPVESVESVGISPKKLESLLEHVKSERSLSFLIVRDDRVVCEWYTEGYDTKTLVNPASATKALFGTLALASLVDSGYMSFGSPCADWITEWKSDPRRSQITLRQLALHRSGLAFGYGDNRDAPGQTDSYLRTSDPYTIAIQQTPLIAPPGTRHHYSASGYAALSVAMTRELRRHEFRSISVWLHKRLFAPMGIRRSSWAPDSGRVIERSDHDLEPLWSGVSCTARVGALIGRLILNGGAWQGQQLIREDVIAALISSDPQAGAVNRPSVAMGWWSNRNGFFERLPRDAVIAAGDGHQIVLVLPSYNLILVRFGRPLGGVRWHGAFWRALEERLLDPLMDTIEAVR